MDYKKELIQLLGYCIENRNFLRNSEGQIDKGAASAYQDIRIKIDEILERASAKPSNENGALPIPDVSNRRELLLAFSNWWNEKEACFVDISESKIDAYLSQQ